MEYIGPSNFLSSSDVPQDERKMLEIQDSCPAHLQLLSRANSIPIPTLVHLQKMELKFGRSKDSVDVYLDSSKFPCLTSRLHAKIVQIEDTDQQGRKKWKVIDCNSVNGLFVNNVKVSEAVLKNNDVITFGGGGGLPLGTRKEQPNSEFIYVFKLAETTAKRKASSESTEDVEKRKKQKPDTSQNEQLLEELRKKNEELENQRLRLKELEDLVARNVLEMNKLREAQEQKEAMMSAKEETFHEQLNKIQAEFANEKARLLEEQERLSKESQNLMQVLEGQKLIEKELQDKTKELEIIKSKVIERTDLEEEFTCTICQELILCAMTLECSHSFCSQCIVSWLERKRQCPVCREPITKSPTKSRTLDNAIGKIVAKLSPEEKKEWEQRVARQAKLAEEEAMYKKLLERINFARSRNLRFLSIRDAWSPAEQKVFLDGVAQYSGKAKTLYCETTGLRAEWISVATLPSLRLAANNIGLPNASILTVEELRLQLFAFIGYGVQ